MANPWEQDEIIEGPWSQDAALEEEVVTRQPVQETATDYQSRELVGLPLPHEGLYEGMAPEDKTALYEAYKKHPNTSSDWMGNLTYRGKPVPKSSGGLYDTAAKIGGAVLNPGGAVADVVGDVVQGRDVALDNYNPGQSIVGGMMNAPREAAITWQSLNEMTGSPMRILPDGTAEAMDKMLPEYVPQNGVVDEVLTEVGQIIPGAAAGGGVAAQFKNLPRFFKTAAKLVGAEGGAVLGMDEDTPGVLVGDDSWLKVWSGVATDENGKYSSQNIKKKMNLFLDSVIVAKSLEKTGKGLVTGIKFINDVIGEPGKRFFSSGSKAQSIVREMADTLDGSVDLTPEQQSEARMKLADTIDRYSKAVEATDLQGEIQGAKISDVNIKRDTMGAYTESLDKTTPEGRAAAAKADAMRAAARGKGAPQLEARMSEPASTFENLQKETTKAFGDEYAINASKQEIQKQGKQIVDDQRNIISQGEQAITDAKLDEENILRNDPISKDAVADVDGKIRIDVNKKTRDATERMIGGIESADDILTSEKNIRYDAIPDNARADGKGLKVIADKAAPFLSDTAKKALKEAGTNYKALQKFSSRELRDLMQEYRGKQEFEKLRPLEDLYRNINDTQLDYLIASGDTETARTAKIAKDFFVKEYAPKFRQGTLEKMQNIRRDLMPNRPADYAAEARKTLKSTLDDPDSAERTGIIIETLASDEGGRNAEAAVDYVIGQVAGDVQRMINNGGTLNDTDIGNFSKVLEKYIPILQKNGSNQVARIDDFLNKLKDKKVSIKQREADLETAVKRLKEIEDDVYNNKLKEFFNKDGKSKSDGFTSFSNVMNDALKTREFDKLDDLSSRIKNTDKFTRSGMKAAYGKWLTNQFLNPGSTPGGGRQVNKKAFVEDREALVKIGKSIFGDDDPIILATEKVMDEAGNRALSETQRAFSLHDAGSFGKEMRESVATVITFVFGTLDRMGARVRAASGKAITQLDRTQQARQIMDLMYSDPDQFTKVLREVAKMDKPRLSRQNKDILWSIGTKAGVFSTSDSFADKNETEQAFSE